MSLDDASTFEGAAQRDLVGVLQIASNGQSGCQSRDPQARLHEQTGEVGRSCFTLEVGVGGDDDFGDLGRGKPGEQLLDAQVVGAECRRWG